MPTTPPYPVNGDHENGKRWSQPPYSAASTIKLSSPSSKSGGQHGASVVPPEYTLVEVPPQKLRYSRAIRFLARLEMLLSVVILICTMAGLIISAKRPKLPLTNYDGDGFIAGILGIFNGLLGIKAALYLTNRCRNAAHMALSTVNAIFMAAACAAFVIWATAASPARTLSSKSGLVLVHDEETLSQFEWFEEPESPGWVKAHFGVNIVGAVASFICFWLTVISAALGCSTVCCGTTPALKIPASHYRSQHSNNGENEDFRQSAPAIGFVVN